MSQKTVRIVSLAFAIATFMAGVIGITSREAKYTAEARILIVPATKDPGLAISAADTLSRGTVVASFAQAYRGDEIKTQAFLAADIPPADAARASVSTNVIAGTTNIAIAASSNDPALAERVATALARYTPNLGAYSLAFSPQVVGTADGSASRSGASSTSLLLIAFVAAGIAGLLAMTILGRIPTRGLTTPRSRHPEYEDDGDPEERLTARR